MAETIVELLTDVADAIRAKKGSNEPINAQNFANEIKNLPSGGGEVVEVERKDVNFYDYEGTLLFSYTLAEAQALTELPTPKGHEGLVFDGWNWDYEDVIALDYPMDIGAMYITDDGKTRLYLEIPEMLRKGVVLEYYQTIANGVRVDWGDGTTEMSDVVGGVSLTHDYAHKGNYLVTLEVIVEGCSLELGMRQSSRGVFGKNSADDDYPLYSILRKAYIGKANFYYSPFRRCSNLLEVSLPQGQKLGTSSFEKCYSLVFLVIPKGANNVAYLASYASSLHGVSLPKGYTAGEWSFVSCYAMKSITLTQTNLPSYFAIQMRGITRINLSTIESIAAASFNTNNSIILYDFRLSKQVPTLANVSALTNINANAKIVVPDALYDEWIAATNWTTYADKIVKSSEYTD